jgi:hypothetical protein
LLLLVSRHAMSPRSVFQPLHLTGKRRRPLYTTSCAPAMVFSPSPTSLRSRSRQAQVHVFNFDDSFGMTEEKRRRECFSDWTAFSVSVGAHTPRPRPDLGARPSTCQRELRFDRPSRLSWAHSRQPTCAASLMFVLLISRSKSDVLGAKKKSTCAKLAPARTESTDRPSSHLSTPPSGHDLF